MSAHTLSNRDFTRDVSAAMRATAQGPVFITELGHPAFVLLGIEEYYRMAGQGELTLLSVMDGIPGGEPVEFSPPRLDVQIPPARFD